MYNNTLDVGDEIPSFNLDSQVGRISFHDIIDGKWCLLVTFGSAFEPVATTDLGMLAKLAEEFESRNIFLLAIGNDTGGCFRF
jgi:alkyl hydroperoxide reductase subunit AhpC